MQTSAISIILSRIGFVARLVRNRRYFSCKTFCNFACLKLLAVCETFHTFSWPCLSLAVTSFYFFCSFLWKTFCRIIDQSATNRKRHNPRVDPLRDFNDFPDVTGDHACDLQQPRTYR
ncbi:hypothetical protein L596_026894 [Steinernema carpocapsae]|uniref:Uncharacterized protein n=1 Tax=Steinernema carpocapsae TaxID=34508 RepID=A0A4V5ZYB0_STECR|nr:hypothetical protein L596_026894 [Steinernema carpocapsae]